LLGLPLWTRFAGRDVANDGIAVASF
jgi:hypothetical protein